jgi:hypothetical protein
MMFASTGGFEAQVLFVGQEVAEAFQLIRFRCSLKQRILD